MQRKTDLVFKHWQQNTVRSSRSSGAEFLSRRRTESGDDNPGFVIEPTYVGKPRLRKKGK